MLKRKELKIFIMSLIITVMASPAFAKGPSFKDAGIALWIFIIIGSVIVLLQLIPAAILFFSFVGSSSAMVFGRKKAVEETVEEKEKVVVPGYEPVTAEK